MVNLTRNKKLKRMGISGAAAILSLLMAIAIVNFTPTSTYPIPSAGATTTAGGGGVAKSQTLRVGSAIFLNGITITGITTKTPSIETITLTKSGNGAHQA